MPEQKTDKTEKSETIETIEKTEKTEKVEKVEKTDHAGSKSPTKRKIKGKNRLAKWFREMRSELKKVVWPTPKQIVNNTFVSLTVMAASAIAVWALDFAAGQIFQAIRTLAGK